VTTRTEQRLADALAARADAVREDSIGSLLGPGQRPIGPGKIRWRALAPLAAAAAVLAVVGGTILAGRAVRGAARRPFADIASATSPPRYYVVLDWNGNLTVRATATGRITDSLPEPERWGGGGMRLLEGVAAAANGRRFVAVYNGFSQPYRTAVYTFTLTGTGHIADYELIRNGVLPGMARVAVAVSPDGSKVAIAGNGPETAAAGRIPASRLRDARIVVIDLRTGGRATFAGGLGRRGRQLGINSVSWADGGRSLVYLAQWCELVDVGFNTACDGRYRPVTELRMISAPASGGTLGGGRTLMRDTARFPAILQAQASPDGRSVVALADKAGRLTLARFALANGRLIAVIYRWPGVPEDVFLSIDGSGRYPIIVENGGSLIGWMHSGNFSALKLGQTELDGYGPAW
jgi:hypothetical protein